MDQCVLINRLKVDQHALVNILKPNHQPLSALSQAVTRQSWFDQYVLVNRLKVDQHAQVNRLSDPMRTDSVTSLSYRNNFNW